MTPPRDDPPEVSLEDFRQYFPHAPLALCVKECARLTVLRRYECPDPILDVGCGDGLFASIALPGREVWGIDVDASVGRWAQASRAYAQIILGDVTKVHLPARFFRSCVANCSLEHVPDIDEALATIMGALADGGRAYLFVPHRDWASRFRSVRLLHAVGAHSAASALQDRIDRTFHHLHLYDAPGWREVAERVGFRVVAIEPVLSTSSTTTFEAFLGPSVLGWINKKVTSRWTNFPEARRWLSPVAYRLASAVLESGDPAPTGELLLVLEPVR
jgi:SAM-dependent methyltransferase